MDEDIHSHVIEIPKVRYIGKKADVLLQKKAKLQRKRLSPDKRARKPSADSLRKYCLPSEDAVHSSILQNDDLFLAFRRYERQKKSKRHRQKLDIKIRDKYKIISTDLYKRLYIEDPDDDVKVVTDFDKSFFEFVDGRVMAHHSKSLYKSYRFLYHHQLRIKQEIGYRNDTVLNIHENYKREQEVYNKGINRFMDQAKQFDSFISEDYLKSMAFLAKWEKLKDKIIIRDAELHYLAGEIFTNTSRLIGLDYKFCLLQKYGRFLYYLSPPLWRLQNREFARSIEIEEKGFDLGEAKDADSFSVKFEKMKRDCLVDMIKPALYYKHPSDLLEMFETIEQQQLRHFAHVTKMKPHTDNLMKNLSLLKEFISQDSAGLANMIGKYESNIEFLEQRSNQLKAKFFQILHGTFYNSVGRLEVLEFTMNLEFVFEKVFGEKPLNLDITTLAKSLEKYWMDYFLRLEKFSSRNVQSAIFQYIESEKRNHKKLLETIKEIRHFERLKQKLLIAFAPPAKFVHALAQPSYLSYECNKKIKKLSKQPATSAPKKPSLTEEQEEYLTIFTDWTVNDNPADYLQSLCRTSKEK